MPRKSCNIDRRGRAARATSGLIFAAAGVWIAIAGAAWDSQSLRWTIACLLAAAGVFQLYEAWAGWCVARAMGIKTPM